MRFNVGDKVQTTLIQPIPDSKYSEFVKVIGEIVTVYQRGIAVKIGDNVYLKNRNELQLIK